MKKYIITLCITALFLFSCGARKVTINNSKAEIKIDSTSVVKKDSSYSKDNNIFINTSTDEVDICPIVDSLPIFVNGIEYKNVHIKTKKQTRTVIDTSKIKAYKNELKTTIKATSIKSSNDQKLINKKESFTANSFLWLILIFIFIVVGGVLSKLYKTYV
jgi:hypothetical protein